MKSRPLVAIGVSACSALALASLTGVGPSAAPSSAAVASAAPSSSSTVVRSGLGNGLGRLVQADGKGAKSLKAPFIQPEASAIRDSAGRVMVDLTPRDGVDRAAFRQQAEAAGLDVRAVDPGQGTLEGFVAISSVSGLAALAGTGTLNQAVAPHTYTGSVADQGVPFQNVNKVLARGIDGRGITVGALSDSYDTATIDHFGDPVTIHAAQDVASGDLPGPGNRVNQTPVKVLQDGPGFDEGRGILQIIHDVAPRSDLCFATADGGEVNYANNIRALADKNGPCKADVVIDDVSYGSEPAFSDGVVSDAVDDVVAKGTSYFGSAGNGGEHQAWRAPVRLVPASSSLANTNLDFSQVPADLYDGGLEDFDPGPGVDPAQTYELTNEGGSFGLQWDDPQDLAGPTLGASIFHQTGEITAADPSPSFTFTATAAEVGQQVLFRTDAIPSGTTDLVLTVTDPDGNVLGQVDTDTSPEVLAATLSEAGDYTITVEGFAGETGDFTVDVLPITGPSKVTTDFNALFFDADGNFLGALADANQLSGRPMELATLPPFGAVQLVISRSGTGSMGATTMTTILFGDMYVDEYYDPMAPATFGHHTAAGTIGVAAYDPFRPFLPEFFTSPGGDKLPVRFDSDGNAYPKVQLRKEPVIASTDGANTTFFVSDSARDGDTLPNFFGTSAAAPHAAAIAALVLDARGGRHSVSPAKMRKLLSGSTFKHDLDPFESSGSAGRLTVTARGEQDDEGGPYLGTGRDPNFFKLTYSGKVPVSSITFFGEGASPTALGHGIVFDPRPDNGVPSFANQGFPFTVGSTSGGLAAGAVSASFFGAGGGQSVPGQFRNMTVRFTHGLKKGQGLTFGVDRDLAVSGLGTAREGNGADELGGAVSIPDGAVLRDGMEFRVVLADGSVHEGVFRNALGHGYTGVDGYGLLDAAQAVLGR